MNTRGFLTFSALMAALVLLLSGCNERVTTLDGSVFIVTQSRESIKMGLVTIQVLKQFDAEALLKKQKPTVEAEVAALRLKIAQAAKDDEQSRKLIANAEAKEAQAKTNETAAEALLKLREIALENAGGQMDFEREKAENDKTLARTHELWAERDALNNSASRLQIEAQTLAAQSKTVSDEVAHWPERAGDIYFNGLTNPVYTVKTDADGKFSLRLPATGRVALVARADRDTPLGKEHYHWLVWVSLTGKKSESIMLSNDNLFAAKSPESLVKLEMP